MNLLAAILIALGAVIVISDMAHQRNLYPASLGLVIIAIGGLVWAIQ